MTTPQIPENASKSTTNPVIGVLLVHGLNGSRSDMAELEHYLQDRGIITTNMILPGHNGYLPDFLSLGWEDWAGAVQNELNLLKQRCDVVFLIGHSLGGALVLHTAAHDKVDGIVTMCAPVHMYPWLKPIIGMVKFVTPLLPRVREDVRDPEASRRYPKDGNRWMPTRPLESLLQFLPHLRAELPHVTVPILIMISIHDHVVPARDGRTIYQLIGSKEKHLVTLHRSFHVIMKDHDREEVFAKTAAFIAKHAGKAGNKAVAESQLP